MYRSLRCEPDYACCVMKKGRDTSDTDEHFAELALN